jgi:cell division protein FtsI (penicillin-binding protein 3)
VQYHVLFLQHFSSFAGYFPAENPKYSCIVVIHKPNKKKGYYGNIVAAPVFKEIAQKIYSNIPEVESYDEIKFESIEATSNQEFVSKLENMIMPDISKYELMDIIPMIENNGYKLSIEGNGNKVRQITKSGTKLKKGQTIKINLI